MDTGNTVTDRSVITKHLHNKLQAGFTKIGGNKINTAKTGSGLRRVGKSKRIKMKINGMEKQFEIRPTVVEDLTDDLNLGNGFLAGTGDCDILYRGDATKLRIGSSVVELVRTLEQTDKDNGCTSDQVGDKNTQICAQPEVSTDEVADALSQGTASGAESANSKDEQCQAKQQTPSHVSREQKARVGKSRRREPGPERIKHIYCTQDTRVKKNTMTFIPAGLSCPRDMRRDILVEPLASGNYDTVAAVYKLKEGRSKIAVLNSTHQQILIPKGTKLGQYAEIEPIKDQVRKVGRTTPKMAEIVKKLKLDENQILKENPVVKEKLLQIVEEYLDVFSDPESVEIGTTDLLEFEVKLKEGAS